MNMNINMNNNNTLLQSLQLMKSQFKMIDSQYNYLISQVQNISEVQNPNMSINNISFQIINFGINMLNLGLQYTNPMMKNNLKEQIDNIINQLNSISNNFTNNNMMNMMYAPNMNENLNRSMKNIKFIKDGIATVIVCDGSVTVGELINNYLIKIGRNDLVNREEDTLHFSYNAELINFLSSKLCDLHKKYRKYRTFYNER